MEPQSIAEKTRSLGQPVNWRPEDGECATLDVVDITLQGVNVMLSQWLPSEEERQLIAKGAKVNLLVWGTGHPPVSVSVDTSEFGG